MTFVSLFAGIGGIDLGLERAGHTCVGQVEIDPFAQRVLHKHWPAVPKHDDVKTFRGDEFGPFDLLAGGYPCQPFSLAGTRQGEGDERHLWPEVLRILRNVRPRYLLVENVPGHLSLGFGRVLGDLAESGYDAEWDCIPASAVGAPHRRDRVFILAHARRFGRERRPQEAGWETRRTTQRLRRRQPDPRVADSDITGREEQHLATFAAGPGLDTWRDAAGRRQWAVEPDVGRVVARVPPRLDGGRVDADDTSEGARQILRTLRRADGASSLRWTARGRRGVQAAEVLLAELREPTGRAIPLGDLSLEGAAAQTLVMRSVWIDGAVACPSCRRAAGEQRGEQHSDALRLLSQLLACDCGAAELDDAGTPTAAENRVDRLRALGNAVVPQVAEWIGRRLA